MTGMLSVIRDAIVRALFSIGTTWHLFCGEVRDFWRDAWGRL